MKTKEKRRGGLRERGKFYDFTMLYALVTTWIVCDGLIFIYLQEQIELNFILMYEHVPEFGSNFITVAKLCRFFLESLANWN